MSANDTASRPKRITFRLNETEQEIVWEQARATGLSASEYIRRRVLGKVIVSKSDLIVLGEITRILNELRRLGGLLKNIHVETHGIYSEDTRSAIVALENFAQELKRQMKTSGLTKKMTQEQEIPEFKDEAR